MSKCRFLAALGMTSLPLCLQAQMTVTGRVTSGDQPIQGASVSIRDLDVSARTNVDGVYSFIIRATQVRGQTITIVARHSRYGSQTAQLALTGGSVVQNFALAVVEQPVVSTIPEGTQPRVPPAGRTLDSLAFGSAAGLDVASALAGHFPGLNVTTASNGGSAPMVFRGPRSINGSTQPLVVVDGSVIDNASYTTAMQRFGLGGFDYGTPLQDLALDDIAGVTLLSGASAVPLYGSRAANGVLFVTTKQGGSLRGFDVSGSVRYSGESVTRLPTFQNRYGQGLGGQFEFFDGQGGGINDNVDQSWGPALDGQPIPQHSLTEPRRPDVRHWLPHPSGVRDYFESGSTIDANVALNATRQWASGRVALNARDVTGVTPNFSSRRLGLTFAGTAQPTPRLTGRVNLQVIDASAENRPATGFDEVNPVSGFTRMGRQVDFEALRAPIMSGTEQLNWIYTTRNNPFFQSTRNSNDDSRSHVIGGGTLKLDIGRGVSATLTGALDDVSEDRNIDVATGWRGLYPTSLGRRDFSSGGTERQTLDIAERTLGVAVTAAPRRLYGFDAGAVVGAEQRNNSFDVATAVADTGTASASDSSSTDITSFYMIGSVSRAGKLFVDGGLRVEQSDAYPKDLGSALFPSVAVTYDALSAIGSLRPYLGNARVRASWWRAGNEITPRVLQQTYAGGGTATDPTLGVPNDSVALPERTTGIEVGTEIASRNDRVALNLSWYNEKSREVLIALAGFLGHTAELTNTGFEAQLRAVPLSGTSAQADARWELSASIARNSNTVDRLIAGAENVSLAPSIWGASLSAHAGQALGVIVGNRYLRDAATGALLLSNGLPIPDAQGVSVLGTTQPSWTSSLRSALKWGAFDFSLLLDARAGGKVFSATNFWGSFAGTLESTLQGRESGLLITGLDSITGVANTDSVTAESYFHSLGTIHEAWVFDASYWKLREARLTYSIPLRFVPGFRDHTVRASLVGRNLVTSARAPNIDPETALSAGVFQGFEMGQLPNTRSIGLQISVVP
jgi:TonB-dependent SusC/RagA subfamily outer membrane receptor